MRLVLVGVCSLWSLTTWAREVRVDSVGALSTALSQAQAGDVITLAAGHYTVTSKLSCSAPGPITVKGEAGFASVIESNTLIAFGVSGPQWTFEDLELRGVCANDSDCEHAFQVTGRATDVVLRHLRLVNFNAQLKVNATPATDGGMDQPNRGLVERCEVFDEHARATSNPVTKLNIDSVDDWVVRGCHLHDFSKNGGNFVSYGSFIKGGARRGLYERNLVVCQTSGPSSADARIGLSFGGGGTGAAFCAPAFNAAVPCDVEHLDGVMRNNLIVNCSDVGVYLNRASNTRLLFNTLIDTNGVDFRFVTTSGLAQGNLLGSVVRSRDQGTFSSVDNLQGVSSATFSAAYKHPATGDLTVQGDVSSWVGRAAAHAQVTEDYCGRARPAGPWSYGALEHALGACGVDAGPRDAGTVADGGMGVDAGLAVDAGAGQDAGLTLDGGAGPGAQGSCGCGTSGSPALFALGVLVAYRRRRQLIP